MNQLSLAKKGEILHIDRARQLAFRKQGDELMILDAEVKEDGMLVARAPKYLSGKKVRIVIKDKNKSLSNWSSIAAILTEAEHLDVPRRSLNEILNENAEKLFRRL